VRRAGIGSHTKPNGGDSEVWLTPPEILRVLGPFDLDPCAAPSPRPWPTATVHIELPTDGLAIPWAGRVFCNPPYGERIGDWLWKMAEHACGVALTFARTETEAWQRWVWPFADSILFIAGRLYFRLPDGSRAAANSGGPSALIAYSPGDSAWLRESGIPGAVVAIRTHTHERGPMSAQERLFKADESVFGVAD
jgi:hypothetical protein